MLKQPTLKLNDGSAMPAFGLGTWKSAPDEVYRAVRHALEVGYRHVDCAAIYGNEDEVGRAIGDSIEAGVVERDDLWVTSKLWNDSHLPHHVGPALEESLSRLGLDYLDLYLMHWPIAFRHGVEFPKSGDDFLPLEEAPLEATWEAMASQQRAGKASHIGVSNMGPRRIEALMKAGPVPAVNQVESHPHLQQFELLSFCAEHGIALTAYSPLGSSDREYRSDDEPPLMDHPTILSIADELDATGPQVLIAWAVQRGTAVIPKSVTPAYIEQNFLALQLRLSSEQMKKIAAMDKGYRYLDGEFFARGDSPYTAAGIWI